MEQTPITLTKSDKAVLKSYEGLMDGLAAYLGSAFELVLHSLDDLDHSAVKVINGYHTGRSVGAPITDLALKMLSEISNGQDDKNYICYQGTNKAGHPLKSTTIAITNAGRIIGLMCINFYMDTPVSELINLFQSSVDQPEDYEQNTEEMIQKAVETASFAIQEIGINDSRLRNREIISRLNAAGIFRIKDAVNDVAKELGISRNTVYLHLRNIRSEE